MATQVERMARVEEKLDNLILEVREMKKGFAAKWTEKVAVALVAFALFFLGNYLVNKQDKPTEPTATQPSSTQAKDSSSAIPSAPDATANASAQADAAQPSDSQTSQTGPLTKVLDSTLKGL